MMSADFGSGYRFGKQLPYQFTIVSRSCIFKILRLKSNNFFISNHNTCLPRKIPVMITPITESMIIPISPVRKKAVTSKRSIENSSENKFWVSVCCQRTTATSNARNLSSFSQLTIIFFHLKPFLRLPLNFSCEFRAHCR